MTHQYLKSKSIDAYGDGRISLHSETQASVINQDKSTKPQHPMQSSFLLSREMQTRALTHLQEAIELLPEQDRVALEQARHVCPDLVERESSPIVFLSCLELNAFTAAKRLAAYWRQRKEILGQDAFSPLAAKREGVSKNHSISEEDDFYQLPYLDSAGSRIFYYRARKNLAMSRVFLLLSTRAESLISSQITIFVHAIDGPGSTSMLMNSELQAFLSFAMPWTLNAVHVVSLAATSSPAPNQLQLLPFLQQRTTVHIAPTKECLFERLLSLGLPRESIPTDWGGRCSIASLRQRRFETQEEEDRKPSPVSTLTDADVEQNEKQKKLEEIQFVMSHLPEDSKAAFLEAMEKVPELVLRESDPTIFLAREKQDVWQAASRMAAYWQRRKEYFGELAFYPLDQLTDGVSGALSAADRETMATGFLTPLPQDSEGRDVFCFDRSRYDGSVATLQATLLRSLFYWCYITMSHEAALSKGVVAIAVIKNLDREMGRIDSKPALDLIQDAFPFQVHSIHVCIVAPLDDVLLRLKQTVLPAIMLRLKTYASINCHIHTGAISHQGIQVPESIGGTWSYETFDQWFAMKRNLATCSITSNVSFSRNSESPNPTSEDGDLDLSAESPERESPRMALGRVINTQSVPTSPSTATDGTPFVETVAMQLEGLRSLEEAMEMLPEEDRAAYIAATRCVPYLVQTESDPLRYLRFDAYNSWAAARRLASYWQRRVEFFGSRAFLPLTLSGNGALNQEDIASFHAGYFSFLPNDAKGRTVLNYDPQRRQNDSVGARLRLVFYVWSLICENDRSLTDGFIGLILLGSSRFGGSTLDGTVSVGLDVVLQVFPTFPHKVHLVNSPTGLGQRFFYEVILPIAIRFMENLLRDRTVVHVGSKEQLMEKLAGFGLNASILPDQLGGPWTYQDHIKWIQERLRLENGRYNSLALAAQDIQKNMSFRGLPPRTPSLPQQPPHVATLAAPYHLSAENKTFGEVRIANTETSFEVGLLELATAIDKIPQESKVAYLRAMEQAPHLVRRESDPTAFLRHARFDAVAAARRLVKYWDVRVSIFESRAFLPLDQTGEGALDRRDLSVLGTAYMMSLAKDKHGRAVLFCDGTRLSRSTRQSRLRTSFYMYSIASETNLSQTAGLVLIYVTTEPSFDRANKECLDLVLSVVPACIRDVHLLRYPAGSTSNTNAAEQRFTDKMDPAMLHQFRQIAKNQVIPYLANSRTSIAKMLEPYGLNPDDMPKTIGGKFGYDRFVQWQELRTRYEWDLPAGVSNKQAADMFDFSNVTPLSRMTEEERTERKRRLNVVHSRRKRERERIEIEVLNEQCDEQADRKRVLQREHDKLASLVEQANQLVLTLAYGTTRQS